MSVPSHVMPHVVPPPEPLQSGRVPWGSPATAEQVPTLPLTSHAAHCDVQAVSQQTPSTQKPEPHSALDEHAMPSGFAHVPALPGVLHFAPPEHDDVEQHTPSTQLPEAHDAAPPAVQLVPSASLPTHRPALQ